MEIKEFVAYEFEDFSKITLYDKEIKWIPVLFPFQPEKNLYFITITIGGTKGCFNPNDRKELKSLARKNDIYINSIYDTCGYNPLLLVVEANNPDSIKEIFTYKMQPRYMSISTPTNILKRFGINKNNFSGIKLNENEKNYFKIIEDIVENIINKNNFSRETFEKQFKNINNWEKFIRFIPINMNKIISFVLIQPPTDQLESEIINEIKIDNRVIDAYNVVGECKIWLKMITDDILEIYHFIESFIKRETHAVAKIVLCTFKENGLLFDEPITPKLKTVLSPVKKDILKYLWYEHEGLTLDRNDQIGEFKREYYPTYIGIDNKFIENEFDLVENEFVYKYSVKLERKGWFKTLLFIKSSLDGKKRVWEGIENSLLDSTHTYFARKHYVVTGDFDFIIPIDFHKLDDLKYKISKFLKSNTTDHKKIEDYVTDIRAYFEEVPGLEEELGVTEIASIKAMMPNSKKNKDKGVPRDIYRNFYFHELKNNKKQLIDVQNDSLFISQKEELSFAEVMKLASAISTIELHTEKLIHMFIRFNVKDKICFEDKLEELRFNKEHLFLWREYKPLHNPDTRMFILTTEKFDGLYEFIKSLDECSRNTITSIIFTQGFFRPHIDDELRCKPCRLPVDSKCDACSQYIATRKKTDVREVNLKIEGSINKCKIGVVQIYMENFDHLLPWHNVTNKHQTIMKMKQKIINYLKTGLNENANIIVFPDMSIQEEFIPEMIEKIKKHKVIIIGGTFFKRYEKMKNRYYLTCPVLISNGISVDQYHVQKNTKSPDGEVWIEERFSNITIGEGRGMLKFINTGFGIFGILICYDFLDDDMFDSLSSKVDLLIVPCWNKESGLRRFSTQVGNAKNKRIFTIYSNNGKYGESGLYAPYKGAFLKKLENSLLKKKKEGVKFYTIDAVELDISRDKTIWRRSKNDLKKFEVTVKSKYEKPAAGENIIRRYNK